MTQGLHNRICPHSFHVIYHATYLMHHAALLELSALNRVGRYFMDSKSISPCYIIINLYITLVAVSWILHSNLMFSSLFTCTLCDLTESEASYNNTDSKRNTDS